MSSLGWILTIWAFSAVVVVGYFYTDVLRKQPEEN